MIFVGVAENQSYTVGGVTPTTPTASKKATPTNSHRFTRTPTKKQKANNHAILIYIILKMNILYNKYTMLSQVPKVHFVGVWECRSGFFKIFFKKIRMFLARGRMCVHMI